MYQVLVKLKCFKDEPNHKRFHLPNPRFILAISESEFSYLLEVFDGLANIRKENLLIDKDKPKDFVRAMFVGFIDHAEKKYDKRDQSAFAQARQRYGVHF